MSKQVEKIDGYKTSDGQLHDDKDKADQWQRGINFEVWFDKELSVGGRLPDFIDGQMMREWLMKNKRKVMVLYLGDKHF